MNVEILDLDPLTQSALGWRLSRDLDDEVGWAEIVGVDVPVNEFPSALISFKDMTIFEREIFASPRNHVMWARTSHVDNPLQFVVPDELNVDTTFINDCRRMMIMGQKEGQSQDQWRVDLPIMSQTSWTSRISFRDLVKLTVYLGHVKNHVKDESLWGRLNHLQAELFGVICEFTHSYNIAQKVMTSYSKAKYLHEGTVYFQSSQTQEMSGIFLLRMTVPLWLRAQIVRHRNLTFSDDFWLRVVTSDDVMTKTIGEPISMEIAVAKEVWRGIISKRSCWLAQDSLTTGKDAWQEILDEHGWTPSMLPCHDGHCPYAKDAALRLTDADPGAPCPRYLNISGIDQEPYHDRIVAGLASRHSYWENQVNRN